MHAFEVLHLGLPPRVSPGCVITTWGGIILPGWIVLTGATTTGPTPSGIAAARAKCCLTAKIPDSMASCGMSSLAVKPKVCAQSNRTCAWCFWSTSFTGSTIGAGSGPTGTEGRGLSAAGPRPTPLQLQPAALPPCAPAQPPHATVRACCIRACLSSISHLGLNY